MEAPRSRPAGPVWLALRADLRLRWRAILGLALLLGLIGGVVLTAATGARRTDTAYPRLLRWANAASVLVLPNCTGLGGYYGRLARLPQVASMWTGEFYMFALPARQAAPGSQFEAVASPNGALGTSTDRVRVLAGRPFDPADPRAVMVDQELATAAHVRPGDTVHLLGVPSTPKTCAAGGGPALLSPARPVPLAFRVSAIVAFDDQVVPAPGLSGAPRVLLSPAFWRSGAGRRFGPGDYAGVRLRPDASLASFRRAAAAPVVRAHRPLLRPVVGPGGPVAGRIGAWMAFSPGRGRTAVPARSSLIATTAAVAAVVAAGIFGASFARLITTPHRYGQNWAEELNLQLTGVPAARVKQVLAAQPGVTGYAAGNYGQVSIGGQAIPAVGVDPLRCRSFVTVLAGRTPSVPGQIALGERTLRALHERLGGSVRVTVGGATRPMRIVGVATFALFSQATSAATDLGTGAALPASVLSEPSPPFCGGHATCYNFVLIRYHRGTGLRAAAGRPPATVSRAGCPEGTCVLTADQRPGEIRNYAGVRDTPLVLGLVLVALAVGTLTHVLLTSVHRRRRDLAVLKTLGMSRRQVRAVVTWQALALASAALALGLPLGVLAGRWAWAVFAGSAGVATDASVPPPLLLAVPAALLAAVLIAAGPGWAAARTRPAAILRAE